MDCVEFLLLHALLPSEFSSFFLQSKIMHVRPIWSFIGCLYVAPQPTGHLSNGSTM